MKTDEEKRIQRIQQLQIAADNITRAFIWADTKQGHKYWHNVLRNIYKVIEEKMEERT